MQLLLCFLYYLFDVIIALATGNRQPRHPASPPPRTTSHHIGHEYYEDEVAFGAGLMVICAVWVGCNVWGLSAMFRKSALMMKVTHALHSNEGRGGVVVRCEEATNALVSYMLWP